MAISCAVYRGMQLRGDDIPARLIMKRTMTMVRKIGTSLSETLVGGAARDYLPGWAAMTRFTVWAAMTRCWAATAMTS